MLDLRVPNPSWKRNERCQYIALQIQIKRRCNQNQVREREREEHDDEFSGKIRRRRLLQWVARRGRVTDLEQVVGGGVPIQVQTRLKAFRLFHLSTSTSLSLFLRSLQHSPA